MQVDFLHVVEGHLEHLADAGGRCARPSGGEIIDLEHQHVAAVVPTSLQQPTRSGAVPQRGDDLQERIVERKHGVAEPEVPNARVGEWLA